MRVYVALNLARNISHHYLSRKTGFARFVNNTIHLINLAHRVQCYQTLIISALRA